MNVIICHEGYEARIRELRAAIALLDGESGDSRKDDPFGYAKRVLENALWKDFDDMCGEYNKKEYTEEEWRELCKNADKHKPADQTQMKKWNPYIELD